MKQSSLRESFYYSALAADPDLIDLVRRFVAELPDRLAAMERADQQRDVEQLRRLAHQLKGAAGSYGFGVLTEASARLEYAIVDERGREEQQAALGELRRLAGCVRVDDQQESIG